MSDYLVAFWNVENLFGPENHPERIPWVTKDVGTDLDGWTEALYQRKLQQLSTIIRQMNNGTGPDILGVCEVEDHLVIADLIGTISVDLPDRDYAAIHATADLSFRGINTAFIYDKNQFSVDEDLVFNHFVMRRTGTRDILQATFKATTSGKELVVMANHWPSRFGGAGARSSAGFRPWSGSIISHGNTSKHRQKTLTVRCVA